MSDNGQAIRDIVKSSSIVYTGVFLQMLIAFVGQIIAARYLPVSDFGGLTTGTVILQIGAVIGALGFSSGLARYLPRVKNDKKRELTAGVISVTFFVSIGVSIIVVVGAPFISSTVFNDESVTSSVQIFGAAIPFATLLRVTLGGIRGEKNTLYRVCVKNISQPIIRITLIVAAVILGLGQAGFATAYAIPYVISAVLALGLLYRALPKGRFSFDWDITFRVAKYSLPLTIGAVAGFIYQSLDVFLILRILGSFEVGVYSVAYAAVGFMQMFSTAFGYLSTPVASELEHDGDIDEAMRIFRSISRWLAILSISALIPLGIFSTQFISVIYESRYAGGGIVLTILAVGFAVQNILVVHRPMIQALGRSTTLMVIDIVAALANLFLNLLFIPRFGIAGAAFATAIAFFLREGLSLIIVQYVLGTTPIGQNVLRPVFISLPFFAVFAFLSSYVPTRFFFLFGTVSVFISLYIITVLLIFGLSQAEIMLIRSAEDRYDLQLDFLDPLITYLSNR